LSNKVHTARLSVFSNIFLVILKVIVGIISGSGSIISEAAHSAIDLVASLIAFFSVRVTNMPPDKEHPYGHGKIENVSGVVEGLLIIIAAIWIVYHSIHSLIANEPVQYLKWGVVVMIVSAIVNFFVSRRLYKVAKETDSIALEADALHLKTDIYTSVGVAAGIGLIWITGWHILDPVIAILVALIILSEAYNLIRSAFNPLLDNSLDQDEVDTITEIIGEFTNDCIGYHHLRTRKSGPYKYIDFHLEVPDNMTVKESHNLCDRLEERLKEKISAVDINIHVEPKPDCK
jgi:cation diffusion facilitator family transporter